MQTRQVIHNTLGEVLGDRGRSAGPLSDEQSLFADGLGLDSLQFATLIVRLEQQLDYDPFRAGQMDRLPRSLGQLIAAYEMRPAGGLKAP